VLVTRSVVDRLEASAALAAKSVTQAMAGGSDSMADAIPFGRGALVSMGPGRYVNRAVGVTIDDLGVQDADHLEAWYRLRDLAPAVEVSAWASSTTLSTLAQRGYVPTWFRSMFALPCVSDAIRPVPGVSVVAVTSDSDAATWRDVFASGFGVTDTTARAVSDEYARADRAVTSGQQFLAAIDGRTAGCCSVTVADGVAWLGAAATLPEFRCRGVQAAMVRHRVAHAESAGCDLAAATALPDGASARNLSRLGFALIQHQVVLERVAA
jgi:GNAT superfamily N-acetyltransferase